MERTVTVRYTVDYLVEVKFDDGFALTDAVSDIDIPENDSKYIGDSFEVAAIQDENGNDITDEYKN